MMCVCLLERIYICAFSYCFASPLPIHTYIAWTTTRTHRLPRPKKKDKRRQQQYIRICTHPISRVQFKHTPAAVSTTLAKRAHDQVWLRSKLVPVSSEVLSDILYCAEANMRGGDKQLCNDARLPLRRQQKKIANYFEEFQPGEQQMITSQKQQQQQPSQK